MSEYSQIAYRLDPVPWVANVLGITPAPWQGTFLRLVERLHFCRLC